MKSIRNLRNYAAGRALPADDILEFHASRLLLLIGTCGTSNRIQGLTKLAKLDFFVRYPEFFERISETLNEPTQAATTYVESSMVRHHYGPWDKRYYQILSYLEARSLITIESAKKNSFDIALTENGSNIMTQLSKQKAFDELVKQMKLVKKLLGSKSGSTLKNMIYKEFEQEVARQRMGAKIQ
ncbi:MAG: hypothetical protein Q8T09_00705 [Candidatus Melainabacteria bacterium]|nr:hypothetical protein [Candidatus Melainabacteria bacterium]